MPFDSTLPVDHAPVVAAELRNQFNALNDAVGQCQTSDQVYTLIKANAASPVQGLPPPAFNISNPPTQAEVAAIADYLGQLYAALTSS